MERIDLRQIRTDGGTQPRAGVDAATVADYAQELADGATFPPVTLFYDGSNYWLADGFHRLAAFKHANKQRIDAEVKQGTLRDAQLFAVGANATHGLRRSRDDKRRAAMMLLEDKEWAQWSNREIARRCKVSDVFIGNMRQELGLTANVSGENGRKYITKHGTEAVMVVSGDVKRHVKAALVQEFKTNDPTVLAAYARSLASGTGSSVFLWKALAMKQVHPVPDVVTECLIDLAQEWQGHAPVPNQVALNAPAILRFMTAVKNLKAADRAMIEESLTSIKRIFSPDEAVYKYAITHEELFNEI